jgi:hypothetical protein
VQRAVELVAETIDELRSAPDYQPAE